MKNLLTFNEFLNESKTYKGDDVYPDWIDPSRDFGKPLKSVRELKVGAEYIIWEPGMRVWHAEYIYQGYTGGKFIFNSATQFDDGGPMEFTDTEMAFDIKGGFVIKQN